MMEERHRGDEIMTNKNKRNSVKDTREGCCTG